MVRGLDRCNTLLASQQDCPALLRVLPVRRPGCTAERAGTTRPRDAEEAKSPRRALRGPDRGPHNTQSQRCQLTPRRAGWGAWASPSTDLLGTHLLTGHPSARRPCLLRLSADLASSPEAGKAWHRGGPPLLVGGACRGQPAGWWGSPHAALLGATLPPLCEREIGGAGVQLGLRSPAVSLTAELL